MPLLLEHHYKPEPTHSRTWGLYPKQLEGQCGFDPHPPTAMKTFDVKN